jgi:hypothetical protein
MPPNPAPMITTSYSSIAIMNNRTAGVCVQEDTRMRLREAGRREVEVAAQRRGWGDGRDTHIAPLILYLKRRRELSPATHAVIKIPGTVPVCFKLKVCFGCGGRRGRLRSKPNLTHLSTRPDNGIEFTHAYGISKRKGWLGALVAAYLNPEYDCGNVSPLELPPIVFCIPRNKRTPSPRNIHPVAARELFRNQGDQSVSPYGNHQVYSASFDANIPVGLL